MQTAVMTKNNQQHMSLQDWVLLFILGLLWGGSFLFGRIAVLEVPPMTLVLLRVALAALTLNALLLFIQTGGGPRPWSAFAIMGLLNNIIPFGLIFYGQTEIGAGLAAIINGMTPIWTILIAHFATADEKLSVGKTAGIVLGFAGVAILIGSSALSGLSGTLLAQLAVVGATISYGCAGVFGRRFSKVPPLETARGQLTMSALMMVPVAAIIDRPWTLSWPSQTAVWSIILLAVLSTALAYVLFFRILARAGALNISLVTLLVPLSAVLLGVVFLDEILQTRHLVGMALILGGLLIIDGRLLRRVRTT